MTSSPEARCSSFTLRTDAAWAGKKTNFCAALPMYWGGEGGGGGGGYLKSRSVLEVRATAFLLGPSYYVCAECA